MELKRVSGWLCCLAELFIDGVDGDHRGRSSLSGSGWRGQSEEPVGKGRGLWRTCGMVKFGREAGVLEGVWCGNLLWECSTWNVFGGPQL